MQRFQQPAQSSDASSSAFNSPRRLCYSNLFILDDGTILKHECPHQGDPLGSLLFCFSIHRYLLRLQSELVAGFMDDLTLGGGRPRLQ